MTMLKAGAVFLILATCAVPFCLSGCRYSHHSRDSFSSDSDSRDASGAVSISRMGGEIDVENAPHGATLSTMGGNIHVGDVASFAKVKTMGGEISIDHATGSVDASTMGGGISIAHVDGAIKASTMGGDISARMVGTSATERDVELTSHGGTITLTVPKDFPMDVRITLAYTKNAPRTYEIIDHVGLEQRETPDWDNGIGTPRKYIRAQGRVGNGLNHVVIETTNGDVILKQQ
jgi:Putative adhesin